METAALWEKIRRQKLLAVIGPSGVGKTSLLRAGVIANPPPGWTVAWATPGSSPALALARALTPELAGDAEAVEELLLGVQEMSQSDNAGKLLSAIARWRAGGAEALLVVDQFEELFTLNPADVQRRFARLLGGLAGADVRLLLSVRDDFLFRCSEHEILRPVFADLTPLRPLSESALRRALVEPAQKRGFDFEDDRLAPEMVEAVRGERGALPLLAFAVSRLWDERDHARKLLTRSAYERIGGVAGALAQHAEATLQGVGPERETVVREIFRNLVTAEGTRAAVDREELLSVFGGRDRERAGTASGGDGRRDAEDVLDALVAARLLTEYEGPGSDAGRRRIEIVHESLLEAWPRLVLWRAQEAEGAVLRDQLKQAARLWAEKGSPDELLWTGRAYEECRLWQARYSGGLTATEESFTTAMAALATRRRRLRRFAVGAACALALGVAAVTTVLWQRAETAERRAREEARRAEAGRLLLLGRAQLEEDPSAALAYAVASLEHADSPEARHFAVQLLWQGPTRIQLATGFSLGAEFSPDGRWLATSGPGGVGTLRLWPRDGGPPQAFPGELAPSFVFGPRSELFMVSRGHPEGEGVVLRIRSVPDWRLIGTLAFERGAGPLGSVAAPRLVTVSLERGGGRRFQSWPLEGGEPTDLGRLDAGAVRGWVTGDPSGRWLGYVDGEDRIVVVRPDRIGTASARLIDRREGVITLAFSPDAARLASYAESGEIRLHELAAGARARTIRGPRPTGAGSEPILGFSPDGSRLVAGHDRFVRLWSLAAPLEAEPVVLRPGERGQTNGAGFEPSGRWLATAGASGVSIWPLGRRYPRVLRAHDKLVTTLAFDPRGRWLVSGSVDGAVRLWSLREDSGGPSRLLFSDETKSVRDVDVDPDGRRVLVGCESGGVWVVPVDGGPPRRLGGLDLAMTVAFSPQGRLAAASGVVGPRIGPSGFVVRVWDLESDEARVLREVNRGDDERTALLGVWMRFTHDGRILSSGHRGVRLWDVEAGTYEVLHATADRFTLNRPSSRLCAGSPDKPTAWSCHDLESGRSQALDATSHSPNLLSVFTLSPDGATLVSSDPLGVVRAGPVTGGPPHLLLGHEGPVRRVAVSPDGQWVASAGDDGTVRLWPIPDVTQPPLHTLPYQELLGRLRALTNLRAVEDVRSPDGYRVEAGTFPGWEKAPTW
jgi:WD40 repeat protein